jgi:hypothetical protein
VTSSLVLRVLLRLLLVILLLVAGTLPGDLQVSDDSPDRFVDRTTRKWCLEHGKHDDLQAVVIDVHFQPEPPLFAKGEGVVVAPLALELPAAQQVLEIATWPAHLRRLEVQGITAAAWEYAGRVHREMRFVGVALVRRPALARISPPASPTFDALPAEQRPEALARAAELEEHGLDKCAAFPEWVKTTAGQGPYTEQVLRLAKAVAKPFAEGNREPDDVCAAIRERRLSPHRGQVAVVMGARELGIPAFAFTPAAPRQIYLVGVYTDQAGWLLLDVEKPEDGWFTGGPPLLTRAPVLGGFGAASHDFWSAEGAAYHKADFGGLQPLSRTEWRGLVKGSQPTDTTEARVIRLAETCP